MTIDFIGEPGYKDRGREHAKKMSVLECTLEQLLVETQVRPQEILSTLAEFANAWRDRAKQQFEQLEQLMLALRAESTLLQIANSRTVDKAE